MSEEQCLKFMVMNYLCWKCKFLTPERDEMLCAMMTDWKEHVAKELGLPKKRLVKAEPNFANSNGWS